MNLPRPNLVIYHGHCADGMGAAWAAHKRLGDTADYQMGLYDAPFPDLNLFAKRHVYLVDFSYSADQIRAIAQVASMITVIDHHKSAMKDLTGQIFPRGVNIHFDMARSGAGMTWDHFHAEPRPVLIDYIEDRDLWQWKLPYSREVSAYISLHSLSIESFDKLDLEFTKDLKACQLMGTILLSQQDKTAGKICNFAFERTLPSPVGALKVMFVNTSTLISEVGNELLKRNPQAAFVALWYDSSPYVRTWSLRANDKFDCSVLAKALGGGGHPNAAGFTTSPKFMLDEIPPTKP